MKRMAMLVLVAACGGSGSSQSLGEIDARCKTSVREQRVLVLDGRHDVRAGLPAARPEHGAAVRDLPARERQRRHLLNGHDLLPVAGVPEQRARLRQLVRGQRGRQPDARPPDLHRHLLECSRRVRLRRRACLQQCDARVAGVSGLCALCLLEGANGGTCASGQTCCPSPHFPTTVEACASVCSPG